MKKLILSIIIISISIIGKAQKPVNVPNGIKSGNITLNTNDFINLGGTKSNVQTQADSLKTAVAQKYSTYTLSFNASIGSPTDATTYYFGFPMGVTLDGNATYHIIKIPTDSKLIGFSSTFRSTSSSQETFSIWVTKNNSTQYLLSDQFKTSQGSNYPQTQSSFNLDFDYGSGDILEFKLITPTWETDPTTWYIQFYLIFKVL